MSPQSLNDLRAAGQLPEAVGELLECLRDGHDTDDMAHCEVCDDFGHKCLRDYRAALESLAALVVSMQRCSTCRHHLGVSRICWADDECEVSSNGSAPCHFDPSRWEMTR